MMQGVVSLVPRPSNPSVVACSTNAGEDLVKLVTCSDIGGRRVDVWRRGTFFLYSSEAAFWTRATSPRLPDADRSVALCPG